MRGPLDIDEQAAAIAATWPTFRLLWRKGRSAAWEGTLTPIFQPFTVRLTYRAPHVVELFRPRAMQPYVEVLQPGLRPRRGDPEGELPHVYYTGPGETDVILCLFDPDAGEWSPWMSLAETTVPWTIDWIASYEGWRATGRWTGGGRHPAAESRKAAA
jgi:hypothetical protein